MLRVDTPLGPFVLVAGAAGLERVYLPGDRTLPPAGLPAAAPDTAAAAVLAQAAAELAEYLAGRRRRFTVALAPRGTPFQRAVWAAVAAIPYGERRTYGEVAARLGRPAGARAVGAANGANPLAPFVPCHRLVGRDGRLCGYAGGLALKQALLDLEAAAG